MVSFNLFKLEELLSSLRIGFEPNQRLQIVNPEPLTYQHVMNPLTNCSSKTSTIHILHIEHFIKFLSATTLQ